jgi:hypothetical protein
LCRLFKECPHPDEKQRAELSRRLSLDARQVKFWFQNRRTQMKVNHPREHRIVCLSLLLSSAFEPVRFVQFPDTVS